eukprot:TRINITY_DN3651_c1_g1_i4.p3 TRINITY_DN3651_c1_g1~~TRINITY_DN3651_c1_g1_i4.p3  ORF type:complete len:144 (-),score=6.76 TRINITY_DN3651_c1_g1_i4:151-582(-)
MIVQQNRIQSLYIVFQGGTKKFRQSIYCTIVGYYILNTVIVESDILKRAMVESDMKFLFCSLGEVQNLYYDIYYKMVGYFILEKVIVELDKKFSRCIFGDIVKFQLRCVFLFYVIRQHEYIKSNEAEKSIVEYGVMVLLVVLG